MRDRLPASAEEIADVNLAMLCSGRMRFDYRYESWVQVVGDQPPRRVDLARLADALNEA